MTPPNDSKIPQSSPARDMPDMRNIPEHRDANGVVISPTFQFFDEPPSRVPISYIRRFDVVISTQNGRQLSPEQRVQLQLQQEELYRLSVSRQTERRSDNADR